MRRFEICVELAPPPPPPAHPLPHGGQGEPEDRPIPERLGQEDEAIEGLLQFLAASDGIEAADFDPESGCFRVDLPDFGVSVDPPSFGELSRSIEEYGASVGRAMRVGMINRVAH